MSFKVASLIVERCNYRLTCNNVSMESGCNYIIRGVNGSGKTTFMESICSICGYDTLSSSYILESKVNSSCKDILYRPQERYTYETIKAIEDIMVQCNCNKKQAIEICDSELISITEQEINKYVCNLSPGRRALLSMMPLVYGLEHEKLPEIILLDEPSAGVSEKYIKEVKDVIGKLSPTDSILCVAENNISFIDWLESVGGWFEIKISKDGGNTYKVEKNNSK